MSILDDFHDAWLDTDTRVESFKADQYRKMREICFEMYKKGYRLAKKRNGNEPKDRNQDEDVDE